MKIKQKIEKLWMNVDAAIQRLSWRFGNGTFTPNQKDINSLNGLIQWVNDQRKITIRKNQLFAKLYIYHFNQFIDKYKVTVFEKVADKELSRLLDMPLESFYEAFTQSLNDNSDYALFIDNGVDMKHPSLKNDTEIMEERLMLKNMSEDDIKKLKYPVFHKDDVRNKLDLMITEALNRFQ